MGFFRKARPPLIAFAGKLPLLCWEAAILGCDAIGREDVGDVSNATLLEGGVGGLLSVCAGRGVYDAGVVSQSPGQSMGILGLSSPGKAVETPGHGVRGGAMGLPVPCDAVCGWLFCICRFACEVWL